MKTLLLNKNIHLSAKFGGISHGEEVRDIARGSTVSFKSDKLADLLVERGHGKEVTVASADKTPKPKAKNTDGENAGGSES